MGRYWPRSANTHESRATKNGSSLTIAVRQSTGQGGDIALNMLPENPTVHETTGNGCPCGQRD